MMRTFSPRVVHLFFAIVCVFSPYTIFAQVPPNFDKTQFDALSKEEQQKIIESLPPTLVSPRTSADTPGAVNCFDYYSFGSVQVDVSPTLEQTLPGTMLTFIGEIKNSNAYPVVDGQVWMKVFKKEQVSEALTKQNGYPLTDFVLVKDSVVLSANENQQFHFDYLVPTNISGGDYEAVFYFTSAHRFNLLGLTFTDDITGNKAPFKIVSSKSPVFFNKNAVSFNETLFRFAAPPPRFTKDEPVTMHAELTNPSDEQHIVEVTWITSKWDGLLESNEVKRETTAIVVAPHETQKISYTPPLVESGVTFLQAVLKDGDVQSILHTRFVRDNREETRINFPSILKYPLKKGEENALFSCLHSTNLPLVTDNELVLTLRDAKSNIIHTYTYMGDITGDMMGLKDAFIPEKDITTFSLTATLKHEGVVVDEVTEVYDCNDLAPENCINDEDNTLTEPTQSVSPSRYVILASVGILLTILMYAVIKRRSRQAVTINL